MAVDKRMSLRKLATKVGMTQAGFLNMLKKETMTVSMLEKVCLVLKTSPGNFFSDHQYYASQVKASEPEAMPKQNTTPLENIDKNVSKIVKILEQKKQ